MGQPTILVVGATGLLGPYVMEAFEGEVVGISRSSYDFTEEEQVKDCLSKYKPDCLVLLAACTDIDACEANPAMAYRVNEHPAVFISKHLSPDSHFIYISTDQVYRSGLQSEEDARPENKYGDSKMRGEFAALVHPKSLILRTNMFGRSKTEGRESLSDFFIKAFRSGEEVSLYENALFSPLHMSSIAEYLVEFWHLGLTGVFNLGSNEGMSKKDFALEIARVLDLDASNYKSVPTPAIDLRMDVRKIESVLQTAMPTLKQEISKLC